MVTEVLAALKPHAQGKYIDATVGGGGHAAAILEASKPLGMLFGCDRDGEAIKAAQRSLLSYSGRFELRQGDFANLDRWVEPGSWDGCLMDLGVSSFQLGESRRGFSLQFDGPLDMRMDQGQTMTAADWLAETSMDEMIRIFREYADEPAARRVAKAIVAERGQGRLQTTGQLAGLLSRVLPFAGRRIHPATRVFQAVRMAVNDELGQLKRGLVGGWLALKPGGRLAVITFHSAEDRVVKEFGRLMSLDYVVPGEVDIPELRQPRVPELLRITRRPVEPGEDEVRENPRARSARLRIFEKAHAT
jgi:16S rRNA (cytosine1402-N4)-methyltransferase